MAWWTRGKTVFVVVRFGWEAHADGCSQGEENGEVPVAAFPTRAAAEAFAAAAERAARRVAPPAQYVPEFTPEDAARGEDLAVFRGLKKLGIAPPAGDDWAGWWDRLAPTLPDDRLDAVWDLFDAIRFYDVRETKLED